MKYKKLLSMVLTVAMIASYLSVAPLNVAATDIQPLLTTLIPQGDMEDETAVFSTTGANTFETDEALTSNPDNKVLKIDGTTEPGSATKFTIQTLTPMTAGRTYFIDFDYKINFDSYISVRNAGWTPQITGSDSVADTWYRFSEKIAGGYTNIITPDTDTYYQDIIVGNNEAGKELYIDNLVFYDITDAVEIEFTNDTAKITNVDGMPTVNGNFMANKGSVAKFKVAPNSGYGVLDVVVNGTTIIPDADDVYSFTVADSDNVIEVITQRQIINLIPQGDMEDNAAVFETTGAKSFVTDQALTNNPNNKVLKINGTTSTGSATKLTIKSLTRMTAGRTYYIDFDYKINLNSHIRVRNASWGAQIQGGNSNANTWYRYREKIISSKTNIITPTADTYYQDIIIGEGEKGKELYIDNLVFYDITDAVTFNPSITDNGAEINWQSGIVDINGTNKTIEDSLVSFTAKAPPGYKIDTVEVDGVPVYAEDGVYSFNVPQGAQPVINITTVEYLIPNVVSVSPENCINMDPENATVTVAFNREIDISTINSESVLIEPEGPTFTVEEAIEECAYNLNFEGLNEGTEYTLTFTNGIKSDEPDEPAGLLDNYVYKFSTHSAANIIENGDMSSDKVLYYINKDNDPPSYKTVENGERVLNWKIGWENAPVNQYLDGANRTEKYQLLPGHKYYAEAKIYAKADIKVCWRLVYMTETDTSAEVYPKSPTWIDIKANEWTDISCLFDEIPSNVCPSTFGHKGYAVRLVAKADSYAVEAYIDDWGLYDCSAAPVGEPELVSSTPANGATDIKHGTLDVKLEFNKPMLPSSAKNIEVTNAEVKGISFSDDKKTCTLSLDKIRANNTINIALKNLKSLANVAMPEQAISLVTEYVNPKVPDITVTLDGKLTNSDGSTNMVHVNGLKMEIKSDVPIDEETVLKSAFISDTENLIKKVEWSANNPDTINVAFNQEVLAPGQNYSVTLIPDIKSLAGTPIAPKTIAFQTMTTAETADLYKNIVSGNDSAGLVEFLKTNYKDLNKNDALSTQVVHTDNELLGKFTAKLISETGSVTTADEIADKVWETALLTIANEATNESVVQASVESILNQPEKTGLSYTYNNYLSQTMKDSLPQKITQKTEPFADAEKYIYFIEEDIILNAFRNSNGGGTVSDIFTKNNDFFDTATKTMVNNINNSIYKDQMYGKLQGMDVSKASEVYNKLYWAYNQGYSTPGGNINNGLGFNPDGGSSGGGGSVAPAPAGDSNNGNISKDKAVFSDIVSVPWAKDAIEYLYNLKVINGKTANNFCPEDLVKREEFVKMLVIAANIPLTDKGIKYSDVSENDWFYPYVAAASNYGLAKGIDNNTYGAGKNITRQDIAVLCSRLLTNADKPLKDEILYFTDHNDIGDYAVDAVEKVAYLGLMIGNDKLEFSPKEYATRAETAVILQRLIALLNNHRAN